MDTKRKQGDEVVEKKAKNKRKERRRGQEGEEESEERRKNKERCERKCRYVDPLLCSGPLWPQRPAGFVCEQRRLLAGGGATAAARPRQQQCAAVLSRCPALISTSHRSVCTERGGTRGGHKMFR
ncbi:hypothetical protein ABVT39_020499 [Epinephelus coioides]